MASKNKKAFTLVEVLTVIVILGILFIVLVANVDFAPDTAREAGAQSTLQAYQQACNTVAMERHGFVNNMDELATYLNERLDPDLRVRAEGDKLVTDYEDPWGTPFDIKYTEPFNSIGELRFTSAGADCEFNTGDDLILTARYDITLQKVVFANPINDPNHIHSYNQEVASAEYFAATATCVKPVQYYYSCTCGDKGNVTFSYGEVNNTIHVSTKTQYEYASPTHHNVLVKCRDCNATITQVSEAHILTVDGKQCQLCWIEGGLHTHKFDQEVVKESAIKTEATCTEPAVYYISCLCGANGTETFIKGEANGHTENFVGDENIHSKCSVCGEIVRATHDLVEEIIFPESCVSDGSKRVSCTCGYLKIELIPASGHERVAHASCTESTACLKCGTVLSAAPGHTPINGGTASVHKKCSVCDELISSVHEFSSSIKIAATCNTKGITEYSCSCGYSYTDQNVSLNPNNHAGSKVYGGTELSHQKYNCCDVTVNANHNYTPSVQIAATCTDGGVTKYSCACGYAYTTNTSAKGHTAGTAATCTEPQTCTGCNIILNAALGHVEVNGGNKISHKKCSRCNTVLNTSHVYVESIITPSTCSMAGTKQYACACGYIYTEALAKSNHVFPAGASCKNNNTCTACGTVVPASADHRLVYGSTADVHRKCSVCGTIVEGYTYHTYTSTIVVAATCTTKGVSKYTCECGYSYTLENIELNMSNHTGVSTQGGTAEAHTKYSCCNTPISNSHSYTKSTQVVPTCTDKGTSKYTCTCGYAYTSQDISKDASNHSGFSEYGGKSTAHTKYSCCGKVISTTHSYAKTTDTAATCTTKGISKYSCLCGYSYTSQDIAKNPNNHAGFETYGSSKDIHTKYSCCGAVISNSHKYTIKYTYPTSEHNRCTGTATCDCGYSISETVAGTKFIISGPTCTLRQKYAYKDFAFTNPLFESPDVCAGNHYEGAIDASNHTGTITNGGTLAAHTKYSCCNKVVSSDHVMGAVTYNWSNDCSSCVATQKCSCGYTITENGTVSQGTYINATCTESAKWDYKATFATLPSSKCPAWHYAPGGGTGHSATTVKTISFNENCTKAIATAYCDVCGDEFTEEAVPTVNQTILATCTTPKRHDHKVTFKYIKEVVLCDKYHETGSPLNHSYGTPRYVWSADHETCTATVKCYRCNEEFTETQNSTLKYTEANCENVARWEHIVEDWDNDVFETILCPVVHTGTSYGDCIIDPETGLCKICGH